MRDDGIGYTQALRLIVRGGRPDRALRPTRPAIWSTLLLALLALLLQRLL